tara:strand:- start:836 stop:1273 length:438 start_codon:yes stop_codon:yes gene_type:complete
MSLEVIKKTETEIKTNIMVMYMISKKHLKGLLFNFVVGGSLIAASGFISDVYSSSLSGIFYGSMPLGLIYLYIYIQLNKNNNESKEYALFSIIGGLIWVIIAVMLWSFNRKNLLINLLITTVVYVLLVIVCYKLTKKFSKNLKNK